MNTAEFPFYGKGSYNWYMREFNCQVIMNDPVAQVFQFTETYSVEYLPAPAFPNAERQQLRTNLLMEEVGEYQSANEAGDLAEKMDALGDIIYVCIGEMIEHGCDPYEIMNIIHTANMSKLGSDGQPIRREDGKIMKGPNYRPPDIAGWIKRRQEEYRSKVESTPTA